MAAYYPLFDDIKEGPIGPPGIGFKLTNTGDYDIERKHLKNVADPDDLTDSATKNYVDSNYNELKNSVLTLTDNSMIHGKDYYNAKFKFIKNVRLPQDDNDVVTKKYMEDKCLIYDEKIDAKNKIITNVKAPESQKDVVNREHLEYYCILWDKINRQYYCHNERISNVKTPQFDLDAANKLYVDHKLKINTVKPDNILERDANGLYVPSLKRNGLYNFNNQRITNVANPIIPNDVATKDYVDSMNFFATVKERFIEYNAGNFQLIDFNMFSSNLLDSNLKLNANMYLKINLYFYSESLRFKFKVKLEIGNTVVLDDYLPIQGQHTSFQVFTIGKINDVIKLSILPDGKLKLKPYLHIQKIEFK